ncbi:MAG TPA: helix-turn-helix transcriptional regulator [Flavobacterium sp.]|nr:helix-turn-helix transcriptional regulator [Flavobacterium sp.]
MKIKEIRKLKKLSQETLAEKTGLSVRAIIDYEKPNSDITIKKLQLIADVLDVSFFDLLKTEKGVKYQNEDALRFVRDSGDQELLTTQRDLIVSYKKRIEELERQLRDRPGKAAAS